MEKREMEQIVEQVTRQVLSALGQGKSPDAQTEGLPKVLVVGGAGQDVPECYRRDVVLLDIEDYRTNRNILRYDRVLIAHLNITQLADIAQGRIGDEVSCAVVHALLNGIETLLLEDALAFRKFSGKGSTALYQLLEGYAQTLQVFGVKPAARKAPLPEPEAAKPAEPGEEPPEDLTVMDEATGVEDTVPAMESETDAQPVAPRLVVAPLVGEEVAAFSVDELTYNETLGDWRTHDGIDIAAEVGTQVIAACSGVVTEVRDDDMMGTLVTIAHDDGYETTYANLRSSPGVGEGQYVSAGEVIGAVGGSSIAEFSMPAHLHFSVSKDGVPCDPKEFLN